MKLIDILSPEDIFHPSFFYDDDWYLGDTSYISDEQTDYLLNNALRVNGENAYYKFLDKNFFEPLARILQSNIKPTIYFPKILLSSDDVLAKRKISFSFLSFVSQVLMSMPEAEERIHDFLYAASHMPPSKPGETSRIANLDEMIVIFRDILRDERKKLSDVQNNGSKSSYYQQLLERYEKYIAIANSNVSFKIYLASHQESLTKIIVSCKYLSSLFSKEINIDELVSAFDYDQFCLIAAKSALDQCIEIEEQIDSVDGCANYLKKYFAAVQELRKENPRYNPQIIITFDNSKKKQIVTLHDIEKEFIELLARHPEFSFIDFNKSEIDVILRLRGYSQEFIDQLDLSKKEDWNTVIEAYKQFKDDQKLFSSWEFIPAGHNNKTNSGNGGSTSTVLPNDEKTRRMVIGHEYLENSKYLFKIYGINNFEGYVGYIYGNGKVIFEKYYENVATKKIAKPGATYIMDITNFLSLSKLSKTDIIHEINHNQANASRVFHYADMTRWMNGIDQALSGSNYTSAVETLINTLIANHVLERGPKTI